MSESSPNFESELQISPKLITVLLVVLGTAVVVVSESLSDAMQQLHLYIFTLSLYAASAVVWLMDGWKPRMGPWFAIGTLATVIYGGEAWLGLPGLLSLAGIPTLLAAAMVSLPVALGTAVVEAALLAMLAKHGIPGTSGTTTVLPLTAVMITLGVVCAAYRRVYDLGRWLWEHFERTRDALEGIRDRKADLHQALDDLMHVNRQLALSNERMSALRMIADEAQQSKTAFVAKVSHEFRAPLNMIIGMVGLMVETPEAYAEELPPELWHDLEIVHRNCQHLSSMINDVLDLSQTEAGRLALHREQADLGEIISSALAVVRPLIERKHLSLKVLLPDKPPLICCDPTRVRQVILNLVSNAARFTDLGSITVHVENQNESVIVGVTDTGPGISQEHAKRLFEPFYQALSDFASRKGGSGLGLSISKQFVELHGGKIWFESTPGAGSTFSFSLPVSPLAERVVRPGHQIKEDWVWRERAFRPERVQTTQQLLKPRVIVCDGSGSLHTEFLRCSDEVEFVDARDLPKAMQELQQCPAHAVMVNASAVDELLPLVESARRENPGTPIIGCSVPQPEDPVLKLGASGYLMKPMTQNALEKALGQVGRPVTRVLVVDDDPEASYLLTRMLRVYDDTLEVEIASSGQQALDRLRSSAPDLVLLDILMPDIGGFQVLECMRRDDRIEDVPVLVVSAQDPADQPLASEFLLVTIGKGLSISKLLRCSLDFSALLLKPEGEFDQVRARTGNAPQVSAYRARRQTPMPSSPP
jgi:signal transduction histidine kinase/CheY-like chemotaxis protein